MAKEKKEKASAKVLDMTNVKDSGGRRFNKKRVPEGDYLARVTAVEDAPVKSGDNKGTFQWLFTITLEDKPTHKYPYYCQLAENQLWKIRNLLLAAGLNVPKKKLKLDPEKVISKLIAVTMEDDEYDGKAQSSIATIFPPSELDGGAAGDDDDDDEEEEAKPAKKKAKKKKADPEPEPEPTKKAKSGKKGKKKVSDKELEELDIDDV
jgi:hypothetical protein